MKNISRSRRIAVIAGIVAGLYALFASTALAQPAHTERALRATLAAQLAHGPPERGRLSWSDLSNGHVVFSDRGGASLPTASLMKLFTTSTALLRLGGDARLSTRVFACGSRRGRTLNGSLYLRGGGDFTFGSASMDRGAYGTGSTVQSLAAAIRRSGVRRIRGSVYGDASLFTDGPGTPFELALCPKPLFGPGCPYGPTGQFSRPIPNGPRTAISYNRGLVDTDRCPPATAAGAVRGTRADQGAEVRRSPGGRSAPAPAAPRRSRPSSPRRGPRRWRG